MFNRFNMFKSVCLIVVFGHLVWANYIGDIGGEDSITSELTRFRTIFLTSDEYLWPNGIIPYTLDPSFSIEQVTVLENVIDEFNDMSCVKWIPRQEEVDYVYFNHPNDMLLCDSNMGRVGGLQTINLGDKCFEENCTEVKEKYENSTPVILHTLGFNQEQVQIYKTCYESVIDELADQNLEKDMYFIIHIYYKLVGINHYFAISPLFIETEDMNELQDEVSGPSEEYLVEKEIIAQNFTKSILNSMFCDGLSYCENHPKECQPLIAFMQECL